MASVGQIATERAALGVQIARLLGGGVELAERQRGEILFAHRNVEAVTEGAQLVLRELLLLVRHHLTLAALAEPVTLDGLREDYGRLVLVAHGRGVSGAAHSRPLAAVAA